MEAALVLGGTLIVLYFYSQRPQQNSGSSDKKDSFIPSADNVQPKPQVLAKPGQKKSIFYVR